MVLELTTGKNSEEAKDRQIVSATSGRVSGVHDMEVGNRALRRYIGLQRLTRATSVVGRLAHPMAIAEGKQTFGWI